MPKIKKTKDRIAERSPMPPEDAEQQGQTNGEETGTQAESPATDAPAAETPAEPAAPPFVPQDLSLPREVKYPERQVLLRDKESPLGPITVDEAKDLLGWDELPKGAEKYAALKDEEGKSIRLLNNCNNRPFDEAWSRRLAQDMLNGYWRPNGENVIIGRTGLVLSGQHRLIALVLAEQCRTGEDKNHWAELLPEPLVLETSLALGFPEDKQTLRTLDNVKPRDFSDVLFAAGDFFGSLSIKDRKACCRVAQFAVKNLWQRTGAKEDALNPYHSRSTNSELSDFIERHKRLAEAVSHIYTENQKGIKASEDAPGAPTGQAISRYVPVGTATALLYLMGTSASDIDAYRPAIYDGSANEGMLSFDNWDAACQFWTLLASDSPLLREVWYVRRPQQGDPIPEGGVNPKWGGFVFGEGSGSTSSEKVAVLVKAWLAWSEAPEAEIPAEALTLDFDCVPADDGTVAAAYLTGEDDPLCGGIDCGEQRGLNPVEQAEKEAKEEEVEAEKQRIKAEKDAERKRLKEEKDAEKAAAAEKKAREEADKKREADKQRIMDERAKKKAAAAAAK